ncbi:MAG: malonyl-[acyl-carrier protein] O-methyltransferase BioC [Fusobacteriia bacterium 4572_132]|nr:MAG: malonyl-[acyl-carrier protein] O-methyltransferase BioC [Fusobacteriia bacterium 4572_132]
MIEKKIVAKNFSRGAKTYDEYALVQKEMAKKLNKLLKKNNEKLEILEIGCGTGLFTKLILKKYPNAEITLIDISEGMIQESKEKFKNKNNIIYIVGDAENLELLNKYDLIVSNATFQWFNNLEIVLKKFKKNLKKDGELVFSTFANQTYKELRNSFNLLNVVYDYSQKFYSKQQLLNIIKKEFIVNEIDEELMIEKYSDLMKFLVSIKKIGSNSAKKNKKNLTIKKLKKLENIYMKNYSEQNKIIVTNHILYFKCSITN